MARDYLLPKWHVAALEWFEAHAGQEFEKCPSDVGLPVLVTAPRPGIWKPAGTMCALSVVQRKRGPYEDLDPVPMSDGTWEYWYHQQSTRPEVLADPWLSPYNRYLLENQAAEVPVGVIVPSDSGRGYRVLGLAIVAGFEGNHFQLVGPVSLHERPSGQAAEQGARISAALVSLPMGDFNPADPHDERIRVIAAVHRRQGGFKFRRSLLSAYEGRCAVTAYDAQGALEAAHIVPYRGPQTNHIANGLLLRADVHDLFDLGLIAVDSSSMRLLLSSDLEGTKYEELADRKLWLPSEPELRPSTEALDIHRAQSAVA